MANKIGRFAAARDALLVAHEHLMIDGDEARAVTVRALAENVIQEERETIKKALKAPGDAWERRNQLMAAIELDGVESRLAAKAARRFAKAAKAAACCAA